VTRDEGGVMPYVYLSVCWRSWALPFNVRWENGFLTTLVYLSVGPVTVDVSIPKRRKVRTSLLDEWRDCAREFARQSVEEEDTCTNS